MKTNLTIQDFLSAETHKDVVELFEQGINKDNYYIFSFDLYSVYIPVDGPDVLYPTLSAHTDTVHRVKPTEFNVVDNVITNANTSSGLGADDRAGVYIMHKLISSGSTDYIFILTDMEECGGIGGKDLCDNRPLFDMITKQTSCFIGLDRKGYDDCASYGFDNDELFSIMEDVGYTYAYGSFTDVMTFSEHSGIACCNLSIGYYNEHTKHESLNLLHMENTCNVLATELPQPLWDKQYLSEVKHNVYTPFNNIPVICDICGTHTLLYDVEWGVVCAECLM